MWTPLEVGKDVLSSEPVLVNTGLLLCLERRGQVNQISPLRGGEFADVQDVPADKSVVHGGSLR